MIELLKEPKNLGVEDRERCYFCCQPTRYWSFQKDVPVCPDCSTKHEESEVPTKEEWFEQSCTEDEENDTTKEDGQGDNTARC
jgi:hypothetical protein